MPGKALAVALLVLTAATAEAAPADDLGKAYAAYRAGDLPAARALAMPLTNGAVLNRDYALFIAAQSALGLGDGAAALALFTTLGQMTASRFHALAAWRAADAQWTLGQHADARRAYEKLVPSTAAPHGSTGDLTDGPLAGDPAVGLDHIAAAAAEAKDLVHAQAAWRRLAIEHPSHPLAAGAEAALTTPLDAHERIERAIRLTDDRRWDTALVELAKVSDQEPRDVRALRDYWIGMTLFKMRRGYDRSAQLLHDSYDKLGGLAAEALFHSARALSRADLDDDAIKRYREVVKKYPSTPWAAEAQFLAGWLEVNRGHWKAALPALEATRKKYAKTKFADDAVWFLGLCHHFLGDHKQALALFEIVGQRGGALEGAKGRYWHARTLLALGRAKEAGVELHKLVSDHPFTWYAILARARLAQHGDVVGPFGDVTPASEGASLDVTPTTDALIARADELIAAGMGWEAGVELHREDSAYLRRAGAARGLPILFDRYARAGNFNRPWELAEGYGSHALATSPDGPARGWWEHAYPLAYRAEVEQHRALGKNPPYYLYSIMQKESGYDPHVVSYADAIGLLQMIPPTTIRVVEVLGIPYTDDLLYQPELNITAGSWYIGGLLEKFNGQIPIGSGSFNCGPKPVQRWLSLWGKHPIDELVEMVGYTQTREYMKKVTAIYARYLYLYEKLDYQQPLTVATGTGRDDIDY